MDTYVTELEVDLDLDALTSDQVDTLLGALEPWHPSLGATDHHTTSVTLTLPAEGLTQAAATGVAIAGVHGSVLAVSAVTERVRDQREGWAPVPDLVSASQAAELLGVTRQRVQQMIAAGTLPATRVGRDYVIARTALPETPHAEAS